MLQALRGVTTPAGDKMSEPLRKAVYMTLTSMLSHPEDVTRAAAAGCLGALCHWLSPEQLHATLTDHLLRKFFDVNFLIKIVLTLINILMDLFLNVRLYYHISF